jgi:hypothetical protein
MKEILKIIWTWLGTIAISIMFSYLSIYFIDKHQFNKVKMKYPKIQYEWYQKINEECEKKNIEPKIIYAIIHSESRWNRFAKSKVGARGLMQLMEIHLPEKFKNKPAVLYDPIFNIELGITVFSDCMRKSQGNIIKAINCYERGSHEDYNIKYLSEIWSNIQ